MSKSIGKNVSGKYRQEFLDQAKQSATDALKTTSKRIIKKSAEVTGVLIGNRIADKITNVLRDSYTALQISTIPLPVTMNRKKPLAKLHFQRSQ